MEDMGYKYKAFVPIVHPDDRGLEPGSHVRVSQATLDFSKGVAVLPAMPVSLDDIVALARTIIIYSGKEYVPLGAPVRGRK